jgi:hypothetical protein
MASSSVEGACVLSELRVLGLNQYNFAPFPETFVPEEAHPKPRSGGALAVPKIPFAKPGSPAHVRTRTLRARHHLRREA